MIPAGFVEVQVLPQAIIVLVIVQLSQTVLVYVVVRPHPLLKTVIFV
jgi:hypothetical protein